MPRAIHVAESETICVLPERIFEFWPDQCLGTHCVPVGDPEPIKIAVATDEVVVRKMGCGNLEVDRWLLGISTMET